MRELLHFPMKSYPAFRVCDVVALGAVVLLSAVTLRAAQAFPEEAVAAFTDRHCSACHNDVDKESGLDLTSLKYNPADPENFQTWVKVHDRVQAGEMPPKEKKRPDAAELTVFVKNMSSSLVAVEQETFATIGRATRRRLNRTEYENALRDLLHAPLLLIKNQLPEDGEVAGLLALLLLGAKGTTNALPEDPTKPLSGNPIVVEVKWKAEEKVGSELRSFRAEEFVHDRRTQRALAAGNWVYTGSRIREDGFAAQVDGSIVSLITDADALVNNPRPGREDDDNWLVHTNNLPALNVPVEFILRLPEPLGGPEKKAR